MFLHGNVWFVEVRQSWFGVLGGVGARCVEARWGMAVMARFVGERSGKARFVVVMCGLAV